MKTGAELIEEERERQVIKKHWTAAHDDSQAGGEIAEAAACYLFAQNEHACSDGYFPWGAEYWKPRDRISNLVRAGALIAAEIDRIQRIRT